MDSYDESPGSGHSTSVKKAWICSRSSAAACWQLKSSSSRRVRVCRSCFAQGALKKSGKPPSLPPLQKVWKEVRKMEKTGLAVLLSLARQADKNTCAPFDVR